MGPPHAGQSSGSTSWMRASNTAHRMRAGFEGRAGSASMEGSRLDAGLVGPRSWAPGVSASGLPMWVTAARSLGPTFGGCPGCQDAVVSVAMDARGRYEVDEPLEELNRREQDLGAAVGRRLGQPIDEA